MIEWVWTVLALLGLSYQIRLLIRAIGDLRFREGSGENGALLGLALARVRHFWVYTAILAAYALVGVAAVLDGLPSGLGLIVFVGSEALMVLDAWQENRTVQRLLRAERRGVPHG